MEAFETNFRAWQSKSIDKMMRLCLNYILPHRVVEGEGEREGEGSIAYTNFAPCPLTNW